MRRAWIQAMGRYPLSFRDRWLVRPVLRPQGEGEGRELSMLFVLGVLNRNNSLVDNHCTVTTLLQEWKTADGKFNHTPMLTRHPFLPTFPANIEDFQSSGFCPLFIFLISHGRPTNHPNTARYRKTKLIRKNANSFSPAPPLSISKKSHTSVNSMAVCMSVCIYAIKQRHTYPIQAQEHKERNMKYLAAPFLLRCPFCGLVSFQGTLCCVTFCRLDYLDLSLLSAAAAEGTLPASPSHLYFSKAKIRRSIKLVRSVSSGGLGLGLSKYLAS